MTWHRVVLSKPEQLFGQIKFNLVNMRVSNLTPKKYGGRWYGSRME